MNGLVVVAAVDNRFDENVARLEGNTLCQDLPFILDFVRMDTSKGGHPSAAFVRAYHKHDEYDWYLFLQDSLRPKLERYWEPFLQDGHDAVAWAAFPPHLFDGPHQYKWVVDQYPEGVEIPFGIFGPIFYATRDAMEKAEPWFPRYPQNRLEAQGTERAWAYTFKTAGIEVGALGPWSNQRLMTADPIFMKTFANRP